MRIIKLVIISALFLFVILVLMALLIPSHIRVSRAIDIVASRQVVFDQMNDLKKWDNWNLFTANSQLAQKTYSDPSSGNKAFMKSDQLIVRIDESNIDSVKTSWMQTHAKNFTGGYRIMELRPGTTTVQWYFDFYFKWYPWDKFSSIVYDRQLGPLMEESLTKLKHLAENNP